MKWVLASSNAGKLDEIRAILADADIDLVAQSAFGIDDAEETGATFVENALIKARHAASLSGLPALADDSGLCVAALGGAPGLRSARYAGGHGDSAANIAHLLDALRAIPPERRAAHFHCTIVLLNAPDDPAPLIAEGRWSGSILEAPRGSGGHGYDPVFLDPASGLSAAELAPEAKNAVSHRGIALAELRRRVEQSRSAG
ncbi:MAG: non-canonical purine NTP pyrophosphatase, RdgB/HAM1 family [Rhodanobacter denitrificans]|uniref:dITP/XTP pyrophosphatase n=1 Tax=Rhodanobacter denitrificans TaxID=666685 RepID=A0A2W5K2F0_9GAMM|nr:MAG: non-canonical purine NTP pyrophosphatase, RdgB/HAM1 family [Rhodanobacter denitrificans]